MQSQGPPEGSGILKVPSEPMAPPVRKALLCNSPFSKATAPLDTTIPSEVNTVPDTVVWAHDGQTNNVHETIHPARDNIIQPGMTDFGLETIFFPLQCFEIGNQGVHLFRCQMTKRRHFVKRFLQLLAKVFFRNQPTTYREGVTFEYTL